MVKAAVVLTSRGNYAKFKKILRIMNPVKVIGGELLLHDRTTGLFGLEDNSHRVYFNIMGDSPVSVSKSIGAAVSEFTTIFDNMKPDIVLLVGDRFETFAAATAAYNLGMPIGHLEGGEVSGALDNAWRNIISEMAEVHFPCTEQAGRTLLGRGFDNVNVVGATSLDTLDELVSNSVMNALQEISGAGAFVDVSGRFLLAVYHPDTLNYDRTRDEVAALIEAVDSLKMPTIWLNANLDAGNDIVGSALRRYRDEKKPDFIHFFKGLPIEYYGRLLKNAACVVGNSSSGVREGAFLGTPNVCIGRRQIGREIAENTTICNEHDIYGSILRQLDNGRYLSSHLYGDGTASERIVACLEQKA